MPEDRLERKTYRKSPGRQYGYEYDPLQSHSGKSQSGSTASRSGTLLSQRPDPRRTRQLLRQSIIASRRSDDETLEEIQPELPEPTIAVERSRPTRRIQRSPSGHLLPSRTRFIPMHDEGETRPRRYGANNDRVAASAEPYAGSARGKVPVSGTIPTEFMDEDEVVQEAWPHEERERYIDPDLDIDEDEDPDDLEQEGYDYIVAPRTRGRGANAPLRSSRASDQLRPRHATTRHLPEDLLEEEPPEEEFSEEDLLEDDSAEDYIYEEDEELPGGLRVVKQQPSSRRKWLIGAGVLVAGGVGAAVVASQSNPKAPSNNVGKQVQDAFNRGQDQGKLDLLAALDTVEGFTLQGAIDAARLTRTAYDVFVSPIIKFGAAITGDFLSGMLNAFKVARNWLAGINQDNATLAAIQKVLEAWVGQVQNLPKQLDAITDTDLDGAQAYLRALQQKIENEKKALNSPTPTPQPPRSSPTPKP